MKYYIPTKVIQQINLTIEKEYNFINIKEKQRVRLSNTLIKLWFYIYKIQQEDKNLVNLKGYVNINSKNLKSLFKIEIEKKRYRYYDLVNLLKDVGLISVNDLFSPDNFSKSYRVETDFINNSYEEVDLDFDIITEGQKNKEYWIDKYPSHKKQIEDLYKIEIDISSYVEYLRSNIGVKITSRFKNTKYTDKNGNKITFSGISERTLTNERVYRYINDALKIFYKNIWVKVSDEGRFYNSITNLSSTATPFLKINRRNIFEIDIANCQPLILSKLINNKQYTKDCENGVFYDVLAYKMNEDRSVVKLLTYKYLFFNNGKLNSGKLYDAMKSLYGQQVIDRINELKETMEIAKEMQKIESSIFVDHIGKLGINMMIRHDAIYVTREDYDMAKLAVIKEFNKIGLNPTIK